MSDHHRALFHHQVSGLEVAEQPGGGFQDQGAFDQQVRREFTGDFRRADA